MNNRLVMTAALAVPFLLAACDSMPSVPSWMGGEKPKVEKLPGERVTVLPEAEALSADPSTAGLPVGFPPVTSNDAWPQHTGVMTDVNSNLALSGLPMDRRSQMLWARQIRGQNMFNEAPQ